MNIPVNVPYHLRWMGECFLEVLRVHPADDESLNSLLTLGICKALAITGSAEAWQVHTLILLNTSSTNRSGSISPITYTQYGL